MKRLLKILIVGFMIVSCKPEMVNNSIQLKADWKFSKKGDTSWYKATVPGVVHTDLFANNLIEDPFWETNELKLQWIENEDWNYKTIFFISKKQYQNQFIELEFEGLDTYAEVYLNNKHIISANNMFRSWKKEVKGQLKIGNNILEVKFKSPINKNKETVKNYPFKLPSGNEIVDLKVSPFTRKAAYHFGWDWGPRFVTSGIWKNIKLNTWNKARINHVFVQTDSLVKDAAYLTLTLDYELDKSLNQNVIVKSSIFKDNIELNKSKRSIKHSFKIDNPKLWWPNGEGTSYLYKLNIELISDNNLLDSLTQKFGIRTVKLVNEKDSIGTSFYFKINGKPLFIKGANYIPQDIFLPRVTDNQYEDLIDKVKKATINMIRVWGGGIYEKELFYDLCDKNGILVWQDFMFANSIYPSNKEFIENITTEITDNVKRLRNHPSIALWCGNNEIEVAWHNWGWQKQFNYSKNDSIKLWNDYKNMFHNIIPKKLKELASKTNYTTTSPLSNWGTSENFKHGTMHYWGVWHGKEPFKNFKTNVGRFMTEYGFQSFPSLKTIQKFASDSSLNLNSETMINRQKSYIGNGLILKHIENWFNSPNSFADFVNKSQQTQAIAYQTAIQAHRSQSPHCMGTMFWQLNDCWPGPSWSVLDYYGEEKIAYKTIKENYKSIIALADIKNNSIKVLNFSDITFNGQAVVKIKNSVTLSKAISIKSNQRKDIKYDFSRLNAKKFKLELLNENDKPVFADTFFINH